MGAYLALLLIIACDLFRTTREGLIENAYTARSTNLDSKPHCDALQAEGIVGSCVPSLGAFFPNLISLGEVPQ